MTHTILFLLFSILFKTTLSVNFPSYIKPCKYEEDVSKCIEENINLVMPYLKKGVPELALPSIDPLSIQELRVNNPKLEIAIKNFNLVGLSDLELKGLNVNLKNNNMDFEVFVPYTESHGDYSIKGTFLVMQLNGAGKVDSNSTKLTGQVKVTNEIETRGGKEYYKVKDIKVTLKFGGDGYLYFNNLFGDREDLTKATNLALNENVIDALNEIKDLVESGIAIFLKRLFDNFFKKFSVDDLFKK